MKKKVILLSVVCATLSVASCRKDYSCECKNIPYVGTTVTPLGKMSKKDAKSTCSNIQNGYMSTSKSISCEIKY